MHSSSKVLQTEVAFWICDLWQSNRFQAQSQAQFAVARYGYWQVALRRKNGVFTTGPGFGLGPVIDARLHEYIRLRLTPNISFTTRRINYHLSTTNRDSSRNFQKTVESAPAPALIFTCNTLSWALN